jgi:hypothetical protein
MTPEARVKRKVREILKQFGCYHFAPVTGGYGSSGVPDIIGCYRGYFFAIECKANGNKPTELQLKNISAIIENGGRAWVVDEHNIMDVRTLLKGIDDVVLYREGRAGTRGRATDHAAGQGGGQARDVGQEDNVDHRGGGATKQRKRIVVI